MLYASNGGFNWNDLYGMPTYLREFYWNELLEAKDAERESYKKVNKKTPSSSPKSITRRR